MKEDMGKFLNEYEELKLLGKGSFAKIYKVRHLELDYIRAIRVLNETVSDNDNDNKVYQSFINECKTLLKLGNGGHPNIVRIYQPRRLQNHALVEMDYIDGSDLDDYLQEKRGFVPIDEVMRFVQEIGSALAYCHVDCYEYQYDKDKEYEYKSGRRKGETFRIKSDPNNGKRDLIDDLQRDELVREYGITHNDLHSKNIMRKRYDGSFILLDFGLAIQDGKAVKSSSRRDGAVEYKAPEKWDREGIISERSDIYSFGILMYEMLAGQVPFPFQRDKYSKEEEALFKLSQEHENATPPDIEPLRRIAFEFAHPGETYEKDYPDWLEKVIRKCLEKNPEDRYANGKELDEEVKRLLNKEKNTNFINRIEFDKLKNLNKVLSNDLIKLTNEKQSEQLKVVEMENEIDKISKQNKGLSNNLSKLNEEKQEFEQYKRIEIEKNKNEIANLKKQNETLSIELHTLSDEKKKLEQTNSIIIEKPVEKIVEVEKPVEIIKKVTEPFWVILSVLLLVSAVILYLQKTVSTDTSGYETTITNLKAERDGLQQQLTDKQKAVDLSNNEIGGLKQQLASNGNTSAMQKVIDTKDREIMQLKVDKKTIETERTNLKNQLVKAQNDLAATQKGSSGNTAELQLQINILNSKVDLLQQQIKQKDNTIAEKDAKINALLKNM
jgi:serine/threonine-protein kinase